MGDYATLRAGITTNIKQNDSQLITGAILQGQLLAMVNELGAGYQFMGVATPETNPGTPDEKVFYIAATAGTYTNFGGIVVAGDEVAVLKYSSNTWQKEVTGCVTQEQMGQMSQDMTDTLIKSRSWLITGNVIYNEMEIPQSYDILWFDGVVGHVELSDFNENVFEYGTMIATRGESTITYTTTFDINGYIINQSISIQ